MDEPERPLFSRVGRRDVGPADTRARAFQLVIVLGVIFAGLAFLAELGARATRLTVVEVDLSASEAGP